VETRLQTEVTSDMIATEKPDMVVVATGAAPFKPPIEAVEAPYVYQSWDVLKGNAQTGKNVVIVGGGSVGLETAIFLAEKGTISPQQLYFLTVHQAETQETLRELALKGIKNVTVIEMTRRMGQDVGPSTRWVIMKELELRGVKLVTQAKMKEIHEKQVIYTGQDGVDVSIVADSVVLAMGSRPENSLAKALELSGVEVHVIGDAKRCGRIGNAIDDGFALGTTV
jgi:2,4-dienoyl-CoA reductase (NADPH2)